MMGGHPALSRCFFSLGEGEDLLKQRGKFFFFLNRNF